jgi:23S rRNA (cytidine1920-2'-O)/16S rRNA (cytidine1409-2'-O)-methyltransferase
MKKLRADELLVQLGLAESRNVARTLILAGQVRIGDGSVLDKPSRVIGGDSRLSIKDLPRYVGRGGEKMEGFFRDFPWELSGKHCLDIGASTGGFTDYLLRRGVSSVCCVDVGHGQLHYKLRTDQRVTNFEGMNAKNLPQTPLPRPQFDVVVMDLSFISLKKILPVAWQRTAPGGLLLCLVKPQFEATRQEVDRGRGIIDDSAIHARVCEEISAFAATHLTGAIPVARVPSILRGGDGNREFFMALAAPSDRRD